MGEIYEVLTVRDVKFTDDKNKQVSGMQIWCGAPSSDPNWNGYEVTKFWIPDGHRLEGIAVSLKRGDQIRIQFDRRGKPFEIEVQ